MNKIPINKPLTKRADVLQAKNAILANLSDNEQFAETIEELCYYVLSRFNFPAGHIDLQNPETIENGCRQILQLMNMSEDILKEELGIETAPEEKKGTLLQFLTYFLEFEQVPGKLLKELMVDVSADIAIVQSAINKYVIHDFIRDGETPRDHNQRTIKDFYDRAIAKKTEIDTYLTSGIKPRILTKAAGDWEFGSAMKFFSFYHDRPYRLPFNDFANSFDHEKVDVVSHRLPYFDPQEAAGVKALYQLDKDKFYKAIFERVPASHNLERMKKIGAYLPLFEPQRQTIFQELEDLYQAKKWYGFYALGLTQIEGLFVDMSLICYPQKAPKSSLSDKVEAIRPFYYLNPGRLDYFKYNVPNPRNAFLHKGITRRSADSPSQPIEQLCNDVMTDILQCLSIYAELNVPANHLNHLVKNPDVLNFHEPKNFVKYFQLKDAVVKNQQLAFFAAQTAHLEKNVFPDLIFQIVAELDETIVSYWERVCADLNTALAVDLPGFDLSTTTQKDLYLQKSVVKKALLESIHYDTKDDLNTLLEILKFLNNIQKSLDQNDLSAKTKTITAKLLKDHKDKLNKIRLCSTILKAKNITVAP